MLYFRLNLPMRYVTAFYVAKLEYSIRYIGQHTYFTDAIIPKVRCLFSLNLPMRFVNDFIVAKRVISIIR